MIVVNQQDLAQATSTAQVPQQRIITQQIPSNGTVVETKPSPATITNASNAQRLTQQVITPMGPLTLTADEYNELMQRRMQKAQHDEGEKRAIQEAQERARQEAIQQAHHHAQQQRAAQQMQEHQNIAVQVQKIVQSLEEDIDDGSKKDDEDMEMQLIVPKMETDSVQGDEGTSSDTKVKSEAAAIDKNAGRPFACDKCGKKFLLKHHLTTHARVHSGKKNLIKCELIISS